MKLSTATPYSTLPKTAANNTFQSSGRLVATNFLTLPSRRDLPDYYKVIRMPIALDIIEARLKRREFANLTELESYFKRMIANAKDYNQKGSEIYDDAERLRKALSNYMTKTNPAYKTPGYVAFPTPLPGEGQVDETEDAVGSDADAEGEIDTEVAVIPPPVKRKPGRPPKNPMTASGTNGVRAGTTPSITESQYSTSVGYTGLTFQQAQEKLVAEMLRHKEDEE
jgi:Bromodomain